MGTNSLSLTLMLPADTDTKADASRRLETWVRHDAAIADQRFDGKLPAGEPAAIARTRCETGGSTRASFGI